MYRHVTPFLKSINTSLSSCSLRDGTISCKSSCKYPQKTNSGSILYKTNEKHNEKLDNDVLMLFRNGDTCFNDFIVLFNCI